MKQLLMIAAILASASVYAQGEKGSKPCLEIKQACEAAGFKKGEHKDGSKGLYKDCMQKLASGEKVEGVTVAPELIEQCKAKRVERKEHKKDKK